MPNKPSTWSTLCHACGVEVAAGEGRCAACGVVMPTLRKDLDLRNHSAFIELRQNKKLVLQFVASIIGVMLVTTLFRLGYEWRRGHTPIPSDWFLTEGYYWIIASAIVGLGTTLALYTIHQRFEKKWKQSGNAPRAASNPNPPSTNLVLGICITLLASLFMSGLIYEITSLDQQRATRELVPALVAGAITVLVGLVLLIHSLREYVKRMPSRRNVPDADRHG